MFFKKTFLTNYKNSDILLLEAQIEGTTAQNPVIKMFATTNHDLGVLIGALALVVFFVLMMGVFAFLNKQTPPTDPPTK